MEYSPFKDYFNLCSVLFQEQETDIGKDVSSNLIDIYNQQTKGSDGTYNIRESDDSFDTRESEDSFDTRESEDSFDTSFIDELLDDPLTPDSISESDIFEYPLIVDFETKNADVNQRQYFRSDSLSSGQYSSDESFSEETASDVGSTDLFMSTFLSRYNVTESTVQTPVQYFVPRKSLEDKYCILCKRNGETREYYTTHVLKDNRGKVICPVLRKYVCPNCNATGDNAHTLRHCPLSENRSSSTTETCYTLMSSCGRRRKRPM